jgi:hypothetical protein
MSPTPVLLYSLANSTEAGNEQQQDSWRQRLIYSFGVRFMVIRAATFPDQTLLRLSD